MTTGSANMAGDEVTWVVRLTPPEGQGIGDLLRLPLALDVWGREASTLIAAAPEATLKELARRRLARIERLGTTADYKARFAARSAPDPETGP
jgi:hypothetical protein